MIDLVCLVADKNMQAAIEGILRRYESLAIREITFEIIVHPGRDSGCFHHASELLLNDRRRASHALVILDRAWEGAPAEVGIELENRLESLLQQGGLEDWARAVVIDPELEVWVFSDSPHVASALGWKGDASGLRNALAELHLWNENQVKPHDPKAAVHWVLRQARKPRSSSIYRELASRVSLQRCQDRSFLRLRELLVGWFGGASAKT